MEHEPEVKYLPQEDAAGKKDPKEDSGKDLDLEGRPEEEGYAKRALNAAVDAVMGVVNLLTL